MAGYALAFYGENPPVDHVSAIPDRMFGIYTGKVHRITNLVPQIQ